MVLSDTFDSSGSADALLLSGADDGVFPRVTFGSGPVPTRTVEEEALLLAQRKELREAQVQKDSLKLATASASEKFSKSIAFEQPDSALRRWIVSDFGQAKCKAKMSEVFSSEQATVPRLCSDWTIDTHESFASSMLSELYSGVSGLIDAGTAYGIRVPPSTRVVFHLPR